MARITYSDALFDSSSLFRNSQTEQHYTAWNNVSETGDKPLEAYRIFQTKEAADTIVLGDTVEGETFYDIYPGAIVSVVKDSVPENNGLYHVEFTGDNGLIGDSTPLYKLVKILTSETGGNGSITVKLKNSDSSIASDPNVHSQGEGTLSGENEGKDNPYIFFVGVDSSVSTQNDVSTMYFNDGVMYDATGSTILTNSDEKLKNIISPVPVDLDQLATIEKVVFSWKSDKENKPYIGTIAQSVEKVYPDLVVTNPRTNTKMVNYNALAVVSLAAIDKLVERINQLEERVAALEK